MTEFEIKFKESTGYEFNSYYKEYRPKLSWYLTKYTKDLKKAEEFADSAFIQGLEKIDTYKSDMSQFITWLTSIAVNLVIRDYKKTKKENTTSIENELSDNFHIYDILHDSDDVEKKIIDDENKAKCERIKEVIETLPDKYKKVMILRELQNKPYKDIAKEITKEQKVELNNNNYSIEINDCFESIVVTNNGTSDVEIKTTNGGYELTILPKEKKKINKDELSDEKIIINSENTKTDLLIIESTNLSTIKSQIKKGRTLIRKKVKKDFELIDKNGIK